MPRAQARLERLLSHDFLRLLGLALEILDLVAGRSAGGVTGELPLAGLLGTPSRRHSSAIGCSPCKPSSAMRIFSLAE